MAASSTPNYLLTGVETARLRFRPVAFTDFDACLEFFLDPRTNRYWQSPITDPHELAREWLAKQLWRYEHNRGGINLMLHRETGELLGWCGLLLQEVDGMEELEVAYSLMPRCWGQGYASEAARACKEFAFGHRLRASLISIIHVDNAESQRVAERNGMTISATTQYRDNPVHIYRVQAPKN